MKRMNMMNRSRRLKNNNHRRVLLKKLHQRVLLRRKQYDSMALNESFQQAC